MKNSVWLFVSLFCMSGCVGPVEQRSWQSIESDLQTKFITATDGTVIDLPEGSFVFRRGLLLDGKANLTIRGAGMDKTFLSFLMQDEGAEGLKISNCQNLRLENFTIEDAVGDNIKITDTNGLTIRSVRSRWTGEPKETNGAYAFYPVLCKRVLIENCIARGASDAGIYVGQSDSAIIRNNEAVENVAGIESENSRWVEIYGNKAYENTGGILVFDLPGLTQYGHTTRVYQNEVYDNNHENFAPAGNIVATVPPGTGVMLLATRNIELFDNRILDNRTAGIAIVSYDLVEAMGATDGTQLDENIEIAQQDAGYDPYPNGIYIHHNEIINDHWFPTIENDFGLLFMMKFPFSTPDIVWDGITKAGEPFNLCLSNNGNVRFADLDAANDFAELSTSAERFDCEGVVIDPGPVL